MLRRVTLVLLVGLCNSAAQQKPATSAPTVKSQPAPIPPDSVNSARLPVKRVVLYKNGIGYFEHNARVHGNQELAIDFTTSQLNDVLKSITVVDLGEGRIGSVRYNSTAPLDERLRSLRLPFGEEVTSADFLIALRGARVDVRSGSSSAAGRLLSVEKQRKQNGKGDYMDVTTFAIVTDGGEMRSFELGQGTSVRITERDLTDEVGRYLNLVGSSRARDLRRMMIAATGSGDRDVFVSYISEVPVWKSTYRIILPEKPGEKPLLQGWAIVDNTVGEDWKDVQLSLVAGAPQSFIQDISQPYYTRRPVVAPPESVNLSPQTHEAAMNAPAPPPPPPLGVGGTGGLEGTVKDPSGAVIPGAQVTVRNEETGASQITTTDAHGTYRFYNVQSGNSALFVDSPGFNRFALSNVYLGVGRMNEIHATLQIGSAAETVQVSARPVQVSTSLAALSQSLSKQTASAEGKGIGDFFEYQINQKITINKNQSALVPILNAHIEAEKVTLWTANGFEDDEDQFSQPLHALWVKNTSGLTLDSGTFNILEKDTFAGEGVVDTIHPEERRLLSYAADAAVRVTAEAESTQKPITHIRVVKGLMTTTREERALRKYTIRNSDTTPRQVVIEDPSHEGWDLVVDGPKPEETTASFHRFRVNVGPASTAELKVEAYHPIDSSYALNNLTQPEIEVFTNQGRVTPAMQEAFQKILAEKNEIGDLDAQVQTRKQELDAITTDQARLRENMKALKGSAEEKALLQRYTRQLDQQEDRLAALKNQMDDLRNKRTTADQELNRMVQGVVLDERF